LGLTGTQQATNMDEEKIFAVIKKTRTAVVAAGNVLLGHKREEDGQGKERRFALACNNANN